MQSDYKEVIKRLKRLKALLSIVPVVTFLIFIFSIIEVNFLKTQGPIVQYALLIVIFEVLAILGIDDEFHDWFRAIKKEGL